MAPPRRSLDRASPARPGRHRVATAQQLFRGRDPNNSITCPSRLSCCITRSPLRSLHSPSPPTVCCQKGSRLSYPAWGLRATLAAPRDASRARPAQRQASKVARTCATPVHVWRSRKALRAFPLSRPYACALKDPLQPPWILCNGTGFFRSPHRRNCCAYTGLSPITRAE